VSRGYIGVTLKDVDPDLRQSLKLSRAGGALVLQVEPDSPGARAGIKTYDLILSVDGLAINSNDELISEIAARQPGAVARLQVLRDGRERTVQVKLAERPRSEHEQEALPGGRANPRPEPSRYNRVRTPLGLSVAALDADAVRRFGIPDGVSGVVVSGVEPMSPADEALLERGVVILEINRMAVTSVRDFQRIVGAARPGDILAFYLFVPAGGQRALRTVRIDTP
jgi:serine protease Do